LTVIDDVVLETETPAVAVAVIVADPAEAAVTSPVALTLAAVDEELHETVAAMVLPNWSRGLAVSCAVPPTVSEPGVPLMATDVSTSGTKFTFTVVGTPMLANVHTGPLPLHATSLHEEKADPRAGVAVSFTVAPDVYDAEQMVPQLIPPTSETTVPVPVPPLVTVSRTCGGGGGVTVSSTLTEASPSAVNNSVYVPAVGTERFVKVATPLWAFTVVVPPRTTEEP
jgi:hypothetical protein